ncbi:MAG: hypothetical protein ABSG27_03195 [Candidatus Acidiferrales bacterium]|jgi:hypothetical protein
MTENDAATAAGKIKKQIPQIRLAIAFPLVSTGPTPGGGGVETIGGRAEAIGAAGVIGACCACSGAPQLTQNFPLSAFETPQRAQNIASPPG